MSVHACFDIAEGFAVALFAVLLLDGGLCCGLIMLGRLLDTLFRRLPWQPSLFIYSLGIVSCLPAYAATYGHGNSALFLRLMLSRFAHVLPPALGGWVDIAVFGLPSLFAWIAWVLCRLENPVSPKDAPAQRSAPSETVWPPPPAEPVEPAEPKASPGVRRRSGCFINHGSG